MKNYVKGYKVFNPDWTCRGKQYKVGEIFAEDCVPNVCNTGMHFCTKLQDCFSYYSFDCDNKVAEVVALGTVDKSDDDSKVCTNKLQIVKELSWSEVLEMVNEGRDCTGLGNTGNWNTGNRNVGSYNTGCFNTIEQNIYMFNKPTNLTYSDWVQSHCCRLLNTIPNKTLVEWVYEEEMTEEEKEQYPTYKTTGGYLKTIQREEAAQKWWDNLSEGDKECVLLIPNFDAEIFKECTGIDVNKEV